MSLIFIVSFPLHVKLFKISNDLKETTFIHSDSSTSLQKPWKLRFKNFKNFPYEEKGRILVDYNSKNSVSCTLSRQTVALTSSSQISRTIQPHPRYNPYSSIKKKEDDGEEKEKNEKQFETIPFPFPTFIIEATRGVLVGTPCVYGALIGWRVARMPGYLCPEASPPWRKRCFRKRGLPLSADQSSTDPRPRKVVRGPLARARVINRTHCACASRALLSPPLPLFNEYPSSPFATLLPLG